MPKTKTQPEKPTKTEPRPAWAILMRREAVTERVKRSPLKTGKF